MKKKLLISLSLFCFVINVFSQETATYNPKEYSKNPVWIKMMDDTNVNYYEAIKAYNAYWKGKEKPEWEDPMMEYQQGKTSFKKATKEKRHRAKEIKEMNQQERLDYDKMIYQVKRFEQWKKDNLPYVQEDGRILTMEERIKIGEQQQVEMSKVEKEKTKN